MTFKDWVSKIIVGDDCSVYDGIMEGDYVKRRDVLNLVEEAFEAGNHSGYCEGLNHGYKACADSVNYFWETEGIHYGSVGGV
jgi:hypothetical protein